MIKPALKQTLKSFDASQYGGAPLLGLNGLVVKTHGSAKAIDVKNSILQCVTFKQQDINGKIILLKKNNREGGFATWSLIKLKVSSVKY